jgi:hypothetical protein
VGRRVVLAGANDTITAWRIVERGAPRGATMSRSFGTKSGCAFVEDVFEREDPQQERIVIGFDGAFQEVDEGDFLFFGWVRCHNLVKYARSSATEQTLRPRE